MDFLQTLQNNAFSQLDVSNHVADTHGWMDGSFKTTFQKVLMNIPRTQPLTVIEVGTWKGLSTLTMASASKEMGFGNTRIIAIDTWLGAPEFWTWGLNDPTRGTSLNLKDGYPTVFYTFTKNVKKLGHNDIIIPFPISSIQALDVMKYYKISADVIYIDAAHEYEPVLKDIEGYWDILNPGGTMIGDDYVSAWPGVIKAVNHFCTSKGLQFSLSGVVWSITKPS